MKSTILALTSVLASVVIAQPHLHNHAKLHNRGNVVTDIYWVTDYEYVTETVDVTTTIWVSEGFLPPTSTTSSLSTSSSSSSPVAAQFFEPISEPATTSSSSVYVAPIPSSTYVAPAPAPTTEAAPPYVAPVVSSSSPAPVYVPETTPVVVYTPPPAATSAAPVASSGSSSGECSSGSPCEGDITYYEAGLGACGWTNNGTIENVVALPHGLMGEQSNGNPYCDMTITIQCTATGKTTTAKVVDKCMGCTGYSIDLSNAAFLDLDDLSVGRTTANWWFN